LSGAAEPATILSWKISECSRSIGRISIIRHGSLLRSSEQLSLDVTQGSQSLALGKPCPLRSTEPAKRATSRLQQILNIMTQGSQNLALGLGCFAVVWVNVNDDT
jgi:hypothetical protein